MINNWKFLAAALAVCVVLVLGLQLAHAAVVPEKAVLRLMGSNQLSLTLDEEKEISVFYSRDIDELVWFSHMPDIVRIEGTGRHARITALREGTAVLEVTDGVLHCNILVTVTP